ncbi:MULTISPECIES: MaoC/PaaZ C-terminal domain-containing protein [unclassified Streptomyces]|uniref:MaoC/PaaZ C-terminal domain-containing protein n=1 Tax=unclassified Streptomyces TaxID=2593676 RepID=UPI00036E939B|nr:MaoC/PaaZ C-terminal domain-containing protein [Streptomyces sp. BoleA5]MYX37444.1 hypothetical protein [Streptomyces sp. SID8377]
MNACQGLDDLEKAVGPVIGHSDWHTIAQDDIDHCAGVTGDHQWIHADPEKAAKRPCGTTSAHERQGGDKPVRVAEAVSVLCE